MREAGGQAGAAYVLGGRVLVFEIVNEQDFWTVTGRRSITLEIKLTQVRSGDFVLDTFRETPNCREALGHGFHRSKERSSG